MTVFLIGFMGSGKSTLGRAAARELGWEFFDLDDYLEAEADASIAALFAAGGEAHFRALERAALDRLIAAPGPDRLIACGGGTPCFGDNMAHLLRSGYTIYLCPDPEEVIARLRRDRLHRPLLRDIPDLRLDDHIRSLLRQRAPFYRQAHATLKPPELEVATLTAHIRSLVAG